MALKELPVRCDIPAYQYITQLEGTDYTLSFQWSEREGFWTMDVMDSIGTPIVMGTRLFTGVGLLDRFVDPALPPGSFFCFDTASEGQDPGRDDFGIRVLMMYVESSP